MFAESEFIEFYETTDKFIDQGFKDSLYINGTILSPIEPSWEELRRRLMATPEEENRLCMTVYPNSISKTFNVNETGPPLMLTSYIKEGYYQEAVDAARVKNIFQTVVRLLSHTLAYYT